jgi:hypothetical protein
MAATNSLTSSLVTLTFVRGWNTGGTNGKRNKVKVYSFVDASNGIAVGGTTNTINATDFGLVRVERCSNLLVYTTSGGATSKIYPAVPASNGLTINTMAPTNATDGNRANPADCAVSSFETGLITVEGV